MTDQTGLAVPIYLAEFEALRREIETRATLSMSLVALELSALGIGLVAAQNSIDLYAGLGFLSTILWLYWLDQTEQIWKLATYIALKLRPPLASVAPESLGWEPFLRALDARAVVRSTNHAVFYITLLFASLPPVLSAVFVVRTAQMGATLDGGMALRFLTAGVVVLFWSFAMKQFRSFSRSRSQMDEWIRHPDTF